MHPVSQNSADRSLIQADDLLFRPHSRRREKIEVPQSSLDSQMINARPLQVQQPAMPQELASTLPDLAQINESESALSFGRKRPYKQPTRYQISKAVDVSDGDIETPHDRPSKRSDPRGQPAQTRLRFENPVNMDATIEDMNDQEPTSKFLVLAALNGHKEVPQRAVTGAAERLDTSPQFLRDISAGPVRREAPEIEGVMSYATSTV